jgi:DnaA family protein
MSACDSPRPAQLALAFPLSTRCHFETFEVGPNAELVRHLQALDPGISGFRGYLLFGSPGVGRTHLLQAACHRHGDRGRAIYLPLAEPSVTPALLDGLDSRFLVALDDVDHWLGNPEAERSLVDLYQGLLMTGGRLLVSAAAAPSALDACLPDLGSRLRALSVYQVQPLPDADKARVLRRLARERGLTLSDPVVEFWLSRSHRDLTVLREQLQTLDAAAMAGQRPITVPLIKEVLGL